MTEDILLVKSSISEGADVNRCSDAENESPLIIAAKNGNKYVSFYIFVLLTVCREIIDILLAANAYVGVRYIVLFDAFCSPLAKG